MLRYKADIRTLLYFVIITVMFVLQWQYGFNWLVYIVYLHFAVSVAVITHNHNHISIWTRKLPNVLTDWWLTVFYGLPVFVWVPTHNVNHHRYNNKEGDVTRTYRHTEDNNIVTLLQYPTISGRNQMKESIIPFVKGLKTKNVSLYREYMVQLAVLIVWSIVFLLLSWQKFLIFILIPQQVSQFLVIIFNYIQHVHADEESDYNHSRNFLGVNLFLFNNGYHTIHHERANLHWSETPEAHNKIAHLIRPDLIEKSFWGYLFRTYILGGLNKRFKSKSMRLERLQKSASN